MKKSEMIAWLIPERRRRGHKVSFVAMMKLPHETLWALLDLYTAPEGN
jgi:hypothetical protein